MLNFVDNLIQKILDTGWTTNPPPAKPHFSFAIPDEDFETRLPNDTPTLDIYLIEMKENRDLRRAEWDSIQQPDGSSVSSMPPAYFDCHYLISAWSPTEETAMTSPVPEEHQILGEVLRILIANPDVVPNALGIGGGPVFRNAHVYLTVAAPDAPRVVNDFWSTMKLPWKPAVHLVVTAPVDPLLDSPPSPMMITLIQRYGAIDADPATFEELIAIGGRVVRNDSGNPIPNASVVRLETNQTRTTDSQGRFTFEGLSRGTHRFRASAAAMTADEHDVSVPDGAPDQHVFKLT